MAAFNTYLQAAKDMRCVDVGLFGVTRSIPVGASDVAVGDDVGFFTIPCAMRLHKADVQDTDATLVTSAQLNRGGTRSAITGPIDLAAGDIIEVNIDTDGVGTVTLDLLLRRI
jgi:hypothetical protein